MTRRGTGADAAFRSQAFTKYAKKHAESGPKSSIARELERISKYCTVVRVLAHTQIRKTGLDQKKAHLMEIQVNRSEEHTSELQSQ